MTLQTQLPPPAPHETPALDRLKLRRGPLRGRLSGWSRLVWPVAALGLILLFNLIFTPGFFQLSTEGGRTTGILINILHRGAPVMLLALGMTLVIATGGIDLSVGAVMAIAGAAAAVLIVRPGGTILSEINVYADAVVSTASALGIPPPALALTLVIGLALLLALVAGLWNGILVSLVNVQPIVATLILMVAGRGVAQLLTDGQIITLPILEADLSHPGVTSRWAARIAGAGPLGLPLTVTIVASTLIVLALLTRATALGLFIESVGNNATASRYSGVNARVVKLLCYGVSGFCAGIAGLLYFTDIRAADANNAGLYFELDAILAVSIGGTALTGGRFSLIGSLIGALVIQSLTTTILLHGLPAPVTLVVKAGVIIAVCLLQSEQFRAVVLRPFRRRART